MNIEIRFDFDAHGINPTSLMKFNDTLNHYYDKDVKLTIVTPRLDEIYNDGGKTQVTIIHGHMFYSRRISKSIPTSVFEFYFQKFADINEFPSPSLVRIIKIVEIFLARNS